MLSVTPAGVFDMSAEEVRSRVDRACAIITRLRFILEGVMEEPDAPGEGDPRIFVAKTSGPLPTMFAERALAAESDGLGDEDAALLDSLALDDDRPSIEEVFAHGLDLVMSLLPGLRDGPPNEPHAPGTRHADVEARIITLRRVSNELTALTADLEDAAHALGRRQGARERRASPDCARG